MAGLPSTGDGEAHILRDQGLDQHKLNGPLGFSPWSICNPRIEAPQPTPPEQQWTRGPASLLGSWGAHWNPCRPTHWRLWLGGEQASPLATSAERVWQPRPCLRFSVPTEMQDLGHTSTPEELSWHRSIARGRQELPNAEQQSPCHRCPPLQILIHQRPTVPRSPLYSPSPGVKN